MRNLISQKLWLVAFLALPITSALAASGGAPALGKSSAAARKGGAASMAASPSQAAGTLGQSSAAARKVTASNAASPSQAAAPLGKSSAAARGSAVLLPGSQAASASQAAPAPLGRSSAAARQGSLAATVSGAAASAGASRSAAGGFRTLVPQITGALPKLSSRAPGALVLIVDGSTSMAEDFAGQPGVTKADAVADVVNRVLGGFVSRHNPGGRIRNVLHVTAQGYGARMGSILGGSLTGKDMATLEEVADGADLEDQEDAEGNMVPTPVWARATASGSTPMKTGFANTRRVLSSWSGRPGAPHLVLGVHVTDGEHDQGEDPADEVAKMADDVEAAGGKLLMTNIHLSTDGGPSVVFPTPAEAARLNPAGRKLFEMSSPVPRELAEKLGTKPGARMMAYNTTVQEFEKVFEAGSSVAAQ